jgi:hypothetical protein
MVYGIFDRVYGRFDNCAAAKIGKFLLQQATFIAK